MPRLRPPYCQVLHSEVSSKLNQKASCRVRWTHPHIMGTSFLCWIRVHRQTHHKRCSDVPCTIAWYSPEWRIYFGTSLTMHWSIRALFILFNTSFTSVLFLHHILQKFCKGNLEAEGSLWWLRKYIPNFHRPRHRHRSSSPFNPQVKISHAFGWVDRRACIDTENLLPSSRFEPVSLAPSA